MNTQVGMYQDKEQIDQYFQSHGIEHADLVEVGPFPTRVEAEEWVEYIEKRRDKGELKCHWVGEMRQRPWFGLTFVSAGR